MMFGLLSSKTFMLIHNVGDARRVTVRTIAVTAALTVQHDIFRTRTSVNERNGYYISTIQY
jgi:hypothetical protein